MGGSGFRGHNGLGLQKSVHASRQIALPTCTRLVAEADAAHQRRAATRARVRSIAVSRDPVLAHPATRDDDGRNALGADSTAGGTHGRSRQGAPDDGCKHWSNPDRRRVGAVRAKGKGWRARGERQLQIILWSFWGNPFLDQSERRITNAHFGIENRSRFFSALSMTSSAPWH
jgi:hypothetical protein